MSVDTLAAPEANPYLQGNFAPVLQEHTLERLRVRGTLPKSIEGHLLRNGPNPVAAGPGHQWFAGDAMLHAIHIADGEALTYRNRWIRTPHLEEVKGLKAAHSAVAPLAIQGAGNVHVIQHAGRILALPEVGLPYEMDSELCTRGYYDFGGKLQSNMTAHPKLDPHTGELHFFGYDFGPVHLRYHVADSDGELSHSEVIDTPKPTMMHDFGVTETRVVFMDFPVVFDMDMVAQGRQIPYRWRDDVGARLGVMPRRGTRADVVWIDIAPCYVYHPLNAFDDGQRIVMDVIKHEKTFVNGDLRGEQTPPVLERWTIDPVSRSVSSDVVDTRGQEFPRVDPRVECRRHRYGYTVEVEQSEGQPEMRFGGLLKHDLQRGDTQVHCVGEHRSASEGVFVPVGEGEDEGYILAPVYDASSRTSQIRVIDATDFEAEPVATIELPVRIPFGFHGSFVQRGS